jgi:hypothetical protein
MNTWHRCKCSLNFQSKHSYKTMQTTKNQASTVMVMPCKNRAGSVCRQCTTHSDYFHRITVLGLYTYHNHFCYSKFPCSPYVSAGKLLNVTPPRTETLHKCVCVCVWARARVWMGGGKREREECWEVKKTGYKFLYFICSHILNPLSLWLNWTPYHVCVNGRGKRGEGGMSRS